MPGRNASHRHRWRGRRRSKPSSSPLGKCATFSALDVPHLLVLAYDVCPMSSRTPVRARTARPAHATAATSLAATTRALRPQLLAVSMIAPHASIPFDRELVAHLAYIGRDVGNAVGREIAELFRDVSERKRGRFRLCCRDRESRAVHAASRTGSPVRRRISTSASRQNSAPPQYVRPHVGVLSSPRSPARGRPFGIPATSSLHAACAPN